MTFPVALTNPAQANAPVVVNENLGAIGHQGVYAKNYATCSGLTWGYHGGRWGGFAVADGTLSLTNAATNYVVVNKSSGAISVSTSTTNWNDTTVYARVYKITTAGSVVTATEDHRAGPSGVHGGSGGGTSSSASSLASVHTQAAQSLRYLMRDGTWRPLSLGTGAVSVGSTSSITDDTKYNTWPDACRLRNGKILLAYAKGDSHHGDNTGKAVGKIGTESPDGTITWGAEFTIYDDPSKWVSICGVSCVSTGRTFAVLLRDDWATSGTGEAGIVYSDDYGATWTTWQDLDSVTGFTQEGYGAGPVVELPNGDLLLTVEGSYTAEAYINRSSRTLKSTDGGLTWGSPVVVRNYATDSRPYYESCLVLLDNGELLCVHRCSSGSGTHYISRSTDYGATWGAPAAAFSGYARPKTIQASTGTLFVITRKNSNDDAILYTSTDRGATWSAETVIDSGTYQMEYGAPLELFDGRILCLIGDQPGAPITNADIKQVYVTETTSPLTPPTAATLQGAGLDVDACGFRGVPQNSQSGNYTCVAADAGKHILHPSGGGAGDTITIPANGSVAYEVGTTLTFVNRDSNSVSIAITTDTMYLANSTTTGTRTLAQNGVATAIKVEATVWIISGTGLS